MWDFLQIKTLCVTEQELIATMPVTEHTCQIYGLLNGGASLALCENCAGAFSVHLLELQGLSRTTVALGISVSGQHLSTAALGETVTCTVTPLRTGKKLHVLEATVRNAKQQIVCRATVTNMLLPRPQN